MYKNKTFWIFLIISIILILFGLFYLKNQEIKRFSVNSMRDCSKYGEQGLQKTSRKRSIEMFKIEKKDTRKPKKYILDNQSINYILDDYYEIDLD